MPTDLHPEGIRADDVPHSVARDYGLTSGMTEAGVTELMPRLRLEVARAVNAWRRHRPDAETPPGVVLTQEECEAMGCAALHMEIRNEHTIPRLIRGVLARSADPSAWCVVRREDAQACADYLTEVQTHGHNVSITAWEAFKRAATRCEVALARSAALAGEAPAAEGDE